MVLQRLEGASDREACDRFAYDLRWRYAAGVVPVGQPEAARRAGLAGVEKSLPTPSTAHVVAR